MRRTFDPFRLLLVSIAGWLGQQQRDAIDYLREENRVLREQLGGRRLHLNDDQRRRLAAKAKVLGRRALREVATIVTPETLLAWRRKLIAAKYDGSKNRGPGRPRTVNTISSMIALPPGPAVPTHSASRSVAPRFGFGFGHRQGSPRVADSVLPTDNAFQYDNKRLFISHSDCSIAFYLTV